MNILFVCTMGKYRSRTAAHVIGKGSRYRGVDKESDAPLTVEDIDWADVIVVMENSHRNRVRRKKKGQSHKIINWDIPDIYDYMQDELVQLIRVKYEKSIYQNSLGKF